MSIVQFIPVADYHRDYRSALCFFCVIFFEKCLAVITRNNLTRKVAHV